MDILKRIMLMSVHMPHIPQEVIKAITHKFIPIDQEIYFDFFELYEGP